MHVVDRSAGDAVEDLFDGTAQRDRPHAHRVEQGRGARRDVGRDEGAAAHDGLEEHLGAAHAVVPAARIEGQRARPEEAIRLLGSRALPLDPKRRHDGVGSAQVFLQAIVGCRALVATHVPARAATLLDAVGVRPVALGGAVEEVLDRVARGTVHHVHEAGY